MKLLLGDKNLNLETYRVIKNMLEANNAKGGLSKMAEND